MGADAGDIFLTTDSYHYTYNLLDEYGHSM